MNIAIGSIWRDSMPYMRTALDQMERLARLLEARHDAPVFFWCENASTDTTASSLAGFEWPHLLRSAVDDCPYFPSKDLPERWRHLAWVGNHVLEAIPDSADVFLYVESDLEWDPEDMVRLIDATQHDPVVAAANLRPDGFLYDQWGTRNLSGGCFPVDAPKMWSEPFHVSSAAGCTAMRGHIARGTRFQPEDCYVGWCRDIREQGHPILLDPSIQVTHPRR